MKLKVFLLTMAMAGLNSRSGFGQDSLASYSELTLQAGATRILNKDLFQAPFTYRGTNITARVSFLKSKPLGQHQVEFTYSAGNLQSVVSPPANNRVFLLNYDYFFKIKQPSTLNKLAILVGGGVHSVAHLVNYHPSIESPVTYISASSALTLSGKLLYKITPRGGLTLQAAVPLVGVNLRPDFEINGKTHSQISYFGKNIWLSGKLEYAQTLNKKNQVVVSYQANYFTTPEPKLLRVMQQELLIGIKKKF